MPHWLILCVIISTHPSKLGRDRVHPRKPSHRRIVPPRPVLGEVDFVVGAELLAIIEILVLPEAAFGTSATLQPAPPSRTPPSPLGAMADEAWPQVVHAKWIARLRYSMGPWQASADEVVSLPGDKCRDFRSLTAIASGDGGALRLA